MKQQLLILLFFITACGNKANDDSKLCTIADNARAYILQRLEDRCSYFEVLEAKRDERAAAIWQRMEIIRQQVRKADSYLANERSVTKARGTQQLKNILSDTKDTMLRYSITDRILPADKEYLEQLLAEFYSEGKWSVSFHGSAAALACLQLQLATVYADVMNRMMGAFEFRRGCDMENINVISMPYRTEIKLGEEYTAEMFLAIVDPKIPYEMFVNNKKIDIQYGRGIYRAKPTKPGVYKWTGTIEVPMPDGAIKQYSSRECTYTVIP